MYILNTSKRLIDFSWNRKKYRLMPAGQAVEVPDDVMKSTFLKALLKEGAVTEVKEMSKSEKAAIKLEQLRTEAKALGIDFTDETTAKELTAAIKKAEKENEEIEAAAEKARQEAAEKEKLETIRKKATELGIEFDDDWTVEDIALAIEYDALAKKAESLGIKVKESWSLEELQAAIQKKEK